MPSVDVTEVLVHPMGNSMPVGIAWGYGLESSRILRSFRVRDSHPYVVHRSTHVGCPIDRTPLAF